MCKPFAAPLTLNMLLLTLTKYYQPCVTHLDIDGDHSAHYIDFANCSRQVPPQRWFLIFLLLQQVSFTPCDLKTIHVLIVMQALNVEPPLPPTHRSMQRRGRPVASEEWVNNCWWGWQNRTDLGEMGQNNGTKHKGTTVHKSFWQKLSSLGARRETTKEEDVQEGADVTLLKKFFF